MSDRVSGRSRRVGLASRIALVLGTFAIIAGPAAPIVGAAGTLTISTPYPEVVAEPGSTATFKLSLSADPEATVSLTADGVPSGWNSRFRGGGTAIDSVFVPANATAANTPDVQFSVDIPSSATAGTSKMTIHADGGDRKESLVVSVRVEAAAAGSLSLSSDFPQLQGSATSTFTFNLSLKNDTPAENTYSINAVGPNGWTVAAKPAGQAQATTVTVAAGSTGSITATATPSTDATAGDFPVKVSVSGGGKTASIDLVVTITGNYSMTVSTPDQVLSTTANAGTEKDFTIVATNTGTSPITGLTATASAPTNWKVTFDPATAPTLAAGSTGNTQQFVAKIIPSADAIAGDYVVTMTVTGAETKATQDIRVRVETPQLWWIAGVVLLVATFAGLAWVFRTYGRR